MGKAEERIRNRRAMIVTHLKRHQCFDIEHGATVWEIAKGLDQAESVIRVDLASMKADGVEQDSKRRPSVFWLVGRKVDEIRSKSTN